MKNKMQSLMIFLLLTTSVMIAQNQVSLLEMDKVKEYLTLNEKQIESINKLVGQIKEIIEEDNKVIEKVKERVKNNDEPGFFEKIGVKRGHDKRASKIEDLIDEIEDHLNDQQKQKYKNIEKPELKPLKKEEIFGK